MLKYTYLQKKNDYKEKYIIVINNNTLIYYIKQLKNLCFNTSVQIISIFRCRIKYNSLHYQLEN